MGDSSEEDGVFQINIYYGVHYPKEEIEHVCAALRGTKYGAIAGNDREITIDGKKYIRNVNSDYEETRGVIFADEMSMQGWEADMPVTFCKFDPAALIESEESQKDAVEHITNIYDFIVAHYNKTGRGLKNLHLGWMVYNCEWCNDDSSSEEVEEVKGKSVSKSGGKAVSKSGGKGKVASGSKGKVASGSKGR